MFTTDKTALNAAESAGKKILKIVAKRLFSAEGAVLKMPNTAGPPERAFLMADISARSFQALGELRVDRAYIGSESCERLLPSAVEFLGAWKLARGADIPLTLLTPPFSEKGVKLFEKILHETARMDGVDLEIVFNDWGAVRILERFPRFKKIMGRLISAHYTGLEGFPSAFLEFLKLKQIRAVEFNSMPQLLTAQKPLRDRGIKVHLHYPFTYLGVTRFCACVAVGGGDPRDAIGFCSKECANLSGTVTDHSLKDNILVKGNAWFSRIREDLDDLVLQPDRVVYNDLYVKGS